MLRQGNWGLKCAASQDRALKLYPAHEQRALGPVTETRNRSVRNRGYIWNFYSKNFKIQTCLFTKHESLQGDSPRVHPNILKCSLHSLVTKGIRLVGFATRAMVCESPTHYLIVSKLISDPWGGGRDL